MIGELRVSALSGGYTRARVLRSVDLSVAPNEVVGLLGANGSGKTTLLRALSGSLGHTRGGVYLDGKSLVRLAPWARVKAGLVHVPEGRHVFGQLTVRENLAVASTVGRGAASVDTVYDLFPRLAERADHWGQNLSGGEQQMLAIGRAMMSRPRVLLVDEMSAGLAPVMVEQLIVGLSELRRAGMSMLLVEQSPHVLAGLVDRVVLLDRGSVVGEGTLAALGGADRLAELYLGVH